MGSYTYDGGGVLSMDVKDKGMNNQKLTKRTESSLLSYKAVDLAQLPCDLEDDGKPLKNEFLENVQIKEEKQKIKEKVVFENYKEESYKSFVKDLLEASDDIFDSKGDDISKKDFLKNEMSLD